MVIRAIRWPQEIEALKFLDASFSSTRIFRVVCDKHSFTLFEELALPPVRKSYLMSRLSREILQSDHTLVAQDAGGLIGVASMRFEAWNRRAMLRHLYISAEHRRRGVGRALMDAITAASVAMGARCMWVETQNINHAAVQFYLGLGFHLCGLDTSLYESQERIPEIGLFFTKPIKSQMA